MRWEDFSDHKRKKKPRSTLTHGFLVVMWLDDSGFCSFSFFCLHFPYPISFTQLNDKLSKRREKKKESWIPPLHISLYSLSFPQSAQLTTICMLCAAWKSAHCDSARTTRSYTNFLFVWLIISLPNNPKKSDIVPLVYILMMMTTMPSQHGHSDLIATMPISCSYKIAKKISTKKNSGADRIVCIYRS